MECMIMELSPVVALAFEVLAGKWDTGSKRKKKLESAGYDYEKIQRCVNDLVSIIERYS